jgi:repressor LexA
MINAGIQDGDILIAAKTNVADDGDIVVALLENEAIVKRFYKENKRFKLQSENNAYEPIYTNEIHILGKVIALHRYF